MISATAQGFLFIFCFTLPAQAQKLKVTKNHEVTVARRATKCPSRPSSNSRKDRRPTCAFSDVKPDCGCTAVDYPHATPLRDTKFTITMTYDARMLGHFNKQAAIYSNATEKPVYLTMKGVVLAEVQTIPATTPNSMGDLRHRQERPGVRRCEQGRPPRCRRSHPEHTENTVPAQPDAPAALPHGHLVPPNIWLPDGLAR